MGKKKTNKEAGHSRLVGCRLNKQENLHMRLVLARQVDLPPPHRNLRVYIKAFMGFNHMYHLMVSTTHCSLYAMSLKWLLSLYRNSGQKVHSKDREGTRSHLLSESRSRVTWHSCPFDDLLQWIWGDGACCQERSQQSMFTEKNTRDGRPTQRENTRNLQGSPLCLQLSPRQWRNYIRPWGEKIT